MCVKIQEFCANCETYFTTIWDIEKNGWIIQCPNCGEMVYVCSNQLIELLIEYKDNLPKNIALESIKEKQQELIKFRNELIEEIKNEPNYDANTKYHLIKQILNSDSYNTPKSTIFGVEEEINKE